MEPNKRVPRIAIALCIALSGIIGGISGALLTTGIWQMIIVAFAIGFGTYLIFLFITLTSLYALMRRIEELNRDK